MVRNRESSVLEGLARKLEDLGASPACMAMAGPSCEQKPLH